MGKKKKMYKNRYEDDFGTFVLKSDNPKAFDKIKEAYKKAVEEIKKNDNEIKE